MNAFCDIWFCNIYCIKVILYQKKKDCGTKIIYGVGWTCEQNSRGLICCEDEGRKYNISQPTTLAEIDYLLLECNHLNFFSKTPISYFLSNYILQLPTSSMSLIWNEEKMKKSEKSSISI